MLGVVEKNAKPIRLLLPRHASSDIFGLDKLLTKEMGFEIVGHTAESFDALLAVRDTQAQVVVLLAAGATEPGLVSHLLGEFPDLTVLTVFPGGRVTVTQQCSVRRQVYDPSPRALIELLRTVVENPCSSAGAAPIMTPH
jgi:DNA-binding NarL/FixJ family response regulator